MAAGCIQETCIRALQLQKCLFKPLPILHHMHQDIDKIASTVTSNHATLESVESAWGERSAGVWAR